MTVHASTIVFVLLTSCAWTILSYAEYARQKGWKISKAFSDDASLVKVASILGLPGAMIAAGYLAVWWSAFVVLIAGFFWLCY